MKIVSLEGIKHLFSLLSNYIDNRNKEIDSQLNDRRTPKNINITASNSIWNSIVEFSADEESAFVYIKTGNNGVMILSVGYKTNGSNESAFISQIGGSGFVGSNTKLKFRMSKIDNKKYLDVKITSTSGRQEIISVKILNHFSDKGDVTILSKALTSNQVPITSREFIPSAFGISGAAWEYEE